NRIQSCLCIKKHINQMKVVIVGSGNVAHVLCSTIQTAGHEITQIISRNIVHANELAARYNAQSGLLSDEKFADADIYIIAVTDAALESSEKLKGLKNRFIVHTAGSIPIDILKDCSSTYGVLYPLQTLSKEITYVPEIPFLIEGNNKETLEKIRTFAGSLSANVIESTDKERLQYHVAAVFAGNFTNHLYAIAETFCRKEKIDFKNLLPLINEVANKANTFSPQAVQTGPAIREDIVTLNRHLQTLAPHADLKYIYLKISESILKLHEKTK
ncbi:MAG: Rossmann-like and DUF2520 domain-containing protein, partial [Ginsengibacter sp.]